MTEAHLNHVGLFVTNTTKIVDFYTRVLGFVVTDADEAGQLTFLSRDAAEHHQLVLVAGRESPQPSYTFSPKAEKLHICVLNTGGKCGTCFARHHENQRLRGLGK